MGQRDGSEKLHPEMVGFEGSAAYAECFTDTRVGMARASPIIASKASEVSRSIYLHQRCYKRAVEAVTAGVCGTAATKKTESWGFARAFPPVA
jgi:hypothetical protein